MSATSPLQADAHKRLAGTPGWPALFGVVVAAFLAAPQTAQADDIDLDAEWGASPAEVSAKIDDSLQGSDWREYSRRERSVMLNDGSWTHFLIFHDDELIAQGYERDEKPRTPRVGTISDIVSYDNDYWAATALESQFGEPNFEDTRTKSEYSQELGDPARRARRSVEWDLVGERYRWKTDDGPVRYSVRYNLKGIKNHRIVRVRPGLEKKYHYYQITRAFRRAGIRLLRRFQLRSKKMVVAMVTSSGEVVKSEVDTGEHEIVPVRPEKDQYTVHDCEVYGQDCSMTFHTYGGWIYRVDLDLSSSGTIGRRERGGFEKTGERVYKRFLKMNDDLERRMGDPTADTSVTDLKNDRKLRKVQRIPQGMEAFWTVWYNPGRDALIRHVITGEKSGASWSVDHKVIFRLHSVTRAFANEAAWKEEASKLESNDDEAAEKMRQRMRERMKAATEGDSEESGDESSDSNEDKGDSEK